MVSITIFSVVSAGVVTYITDSLRRLSVETKAALSAQELKNAISLMQSEMRMSSSVSPYNVGVDPTIVTCSAQFVTTPTTVRFLVSHDDPSGTSGSQVYYVGYEYSAATQTLYRGEVAGVSATSCTLPLGDPLASATKKVLATKVVSIDADNDGTADNAFTRSGNQFIVHLGAQVTGPGGMSVTQPVTDTILTRAT